MLSDNNPLLESQMKLWHKKIKPNLDKALELTPEDKLDWAPADNMIQLGKVFLHICECSDWWYDDVIKGKPATELAFPDVPCLPGEQIAEHLKIHWERMERFFAEPPEVLEKVYTRKVGDDEFSLDGYWIFTHLLEHDLHHRSQINQYLRILGITPPKM